LESLRETTKISLIITNVFRDLNLGPLEYEAQVLTTTRPRRLVMYRTMERTRRFVRLQGTGLASPLTIKEGYKIYQGAGLAQAV
jgi:hypothetical protein